jgi:alpha-tubulin suppressor-like RCC1 family protein
MTKALKLGRCVHAGAWVLAAVAAAACGQVTDTADSHDDAADSDGGLPPRGQIAAGAFHTCARVVDGTVRCWGENFYGQLGDGTTTDRATPVAIADLTGVADLAAGISHTCARLTDGTARCWGNNEFGELGDGTTTDRRTPVVVAGLSGVAQLAANEFRTCARLVDGTVRCWGRDTGGSLGTGVTETCVSRGVSTNVWPCARTPVAIAGLGDVAEVAVGDDHACARLTDGTARCWGGNSYGELGDGTTRQSPTPVAVASLTDVAGIAAGYYHTCARVTDGTARCWGSTADGELGDGATTETRRETAVAVAGLNDVAQIVAFGARTCARLTNGSVSCWGGGPLGSLGAATVADCARPPAAVGRPCSWTPVAILGLTDAVEIASGSEHTCARRRDRTVLCWGGNDYGQLGASASETCFDPISPGRGFACARTPVAVTGLP